MPVIAAARYHVGLASEYARRHFSDPQLTREDAAAIVGVNDRTLARSFEACETSWHAIVHPLRIERGLLLLRSQLYPVADIARLSGYESPSAFARAVKTETGSSPSEYRKGKTGVKRAGGATGAFARRRNKQTRPGIHAGWIAVYYQQRLEAEQRIAERLEVEMRPSGMTVEAIEEEVAKPRRPRHERAYWKEQRHAFNVWVDTNSARLSSGEDEDDQLLRWSK